MSSTADASRVSRSRASTSNITDCQGAEVLFHDLSYDITTKVNGEKTTKRLLSHLSGIARPGTMTAVMGASGGGKTTLLNALSGRLDPSRVSGTILVNGKKTGRDFKYMAGYVVQEDILSGNLTVRENLLFSARLRLPSTVTEDDIEARVTEVIELLRLEKVSSSYVGTQFRRGISGGEKRRLMIGMELMMAPDVLFLDEPTTGLDATTALQLVQLLRSIADGGRTIVLSVHQPRFRIFQEFDDLILMAEGKAIYQGPAGSAVEYFSEQLGYECEAFNNPPDFFLDVALMNINDRSGTSPVDEKREGAVTIEMKSVTGEKKADLFESGKSRYERLKAHVNVLSDAYSTSQLYMSSKQLIDEKLISYNRSDSDSSLTSLVQKERSMFRESKVLSKRMLQNVFRDPAAAIFQVLSSWFMAAFFGWTYYDIPNDQVGVQDRRAAVYFPLMFLVFSNFSALPLLLLEKRLFLHERANGYYGTRSYFLSKFLFDIVPLRVIPVLPFCAITYYMYGFQDDQSKFWEYVAVYVFASLIGAGYGYFLSTLTDSIEIANLAFAVMIVMQMLYGNGMFIREESTPGELHWLSYLSLFTYVYEPVISNEMSGLTFQCPNATSTDGCAYPTGQAFIDELGFSTDDFGKNVGVLCAICAVYFSVVYFRLTRMRSRA